MSSGLKDSFPLFLWEDTDIKFCRTPSLELQDIEIQSGKARTSHKGLGGIFL